MSKVVKGVGRAIGKVVKGVANVVKKVAGSKLGKIILGAATIYFGGAALMGALGGASAGTGFMGTLSGALNGAMTGISNAWTSLGTAASQALGGNFASAGKALSGGFQGSAVTAGAEGSLLTQPLSFSNAGQVAVQGGSGNLMPNGLPTGIDPNSSGVTDYIFKQGVTPGGGGGNGGGLISNLWNGMGDRAKASTIMGGTQLIGGVMKGHGAQKQQEYQEQLAGQARDRYNTNVGTRLWG